MNGGSTRDGILFTTEKEGALKPQEDVGESYLPPEEADLKTTRLE